MSGWRLCSECSEEWPDDCFPEPDEPVCGACRDEHPERYARASVVCVACHKQYTTSITLCCADCRRRANVVNDAVREANRRRAERLAGRSA